MRRTADALARAASAALVAAALLALAGCGGSSAGSSSGGGSSGGSSVLTISAATSLKRALAKLGGARYQFGGSDILAAQIEQGARPDVYAAANTKLPAMLHAKGLVGTPVTFARNELVIAVAPGSRIHSLADLERPGVKLVIGSPTVPVGAYTRTVLARLGPPARRILANVRSQEPDVGGVVGKLTTGAADAGFTYVTDVEATQGALRAVMLPQTLKPSTALAAAVVSGNHHRGAAEAYVRALKSGAGQRALAAAGFLPPP